jgi:hypothetical protein
MSSIAPSRRPILIVIGVLACHGTPTTADLPPSGSVSPPESIEGATFGNRLDLEGEWLAIGADRDAHVAEPGTVHVYRREGDAWAHRQVLVAPDAAAGDHFGLPVTIREDVMVVGAPGDDDLGFWSGAAYVFRLLDETWTFEAKLLPPVAENSNALFGLSVCFGRSNEEIVVGAYLESIEEDAEGGVWIFHREAEGWVARQRLGLPGPHVAAYFGRSVAARGDLLAIGTSGLVGQAGFRHGGVALHRPVGDLWELDTMLIPAQPEPYQVFGEWIDLAGDRLVVGAPFEDAFGVDVGAVHAYRIIGGQPWFDRLIGPDDPTGIKGFGFPCTLSADGDRLYAGGYASEVDGMIEAGSGWILEHDDLEWGPAVRLRPEAAEASAFFGIGAALDTDRILVSAPRADAGGLDAGQVLEFPLPDCDGNGRLDAAEILEGGVGDSDGDGIPDACELLAGDVDGDGVVNGVDLGHFNSLWGTDGSDGGDFNGDGIVDGGDLAILLGNWAY